MPILSSLSINIAAIKSLSDLIEKLISAPQKRRKLRLEELFRPLHESFQEVHADYTAMIRKLERSLPERNSHGFLTVEYGAKEIDEYESVEIIQKVKREFEDSRQSRESVRDWLRTNAKTILEHVQEQEERRYLYVLMIYFLSNDHFPYPSDDSLEICISEILQRGGNSALSTPTSKLSTEIRGRLDADEIRKAAQESINDLNQRCSDVIRAYVALVAHSIEKTS